VTPRLDHDHVTRHLDGRVFRKESAKLLMDPFKGPRRHPQKNDARVGLPRHESECAVPLVSSDEDSTVLTGTFEEGGI
jgi:hypothetical protein